MWGKLSAGLRRRSSLFAGFYNYTIYVKTGDQPGAGTDANVYVIMHGERKETSAELKLSAMFRDNFERGRMDRFKIKYQPFSVLDHIEIWRDNSGFNSEWFLDTIMIVNQETKIKTVFPIYRWIRPNYRYKFFPLDTSIPQNNLECAEQRKRDLEEKQEIYQYTVNAPGQLIQCKTLPPDEQFPPELTWDIARLKTKLSVKGKLVRLSTGHWKNIDDIKNVFSKRTFPAPSNLDRWNDDAAFGLQRIAGVNNNFIRRCKIIPDNFAVTDEMVEPFLGGLSLALALSDRRIFIIDYSILNNCPTLPEYTVCAPLALFFERNDGILVPIAIQLFQEKADDNPVFLPTDSAYTWALAKMWYNNADACVHQAVVHLGSTHFIMEGVTIATHRQISQSHPVFKLLAPHMRHILATNQRAQDKLLAPGSGWLEATMSIGADGFLHLIRQYQSTWRMDVQGTLPADLRSRGVEETEILKHYYFRNDALLLYEIISKYVSNYLKIYYDTDEAIAADEEIQNWREELVKPVDEGGLGLQGVPGGSDKFTSRQQLVNVCCCIIFTCSIAHEGSKSKQYDEYAFTPNYPAKLFGDPPRDKTPRTEEDVLLAIPDKASTLDILKIARLLTEKRSKSLGDFEVNFIYDPKAVKVVKEFREELKKASGTIKTRNRTRDPPYHYLDPAEIPNNICI